MEFQLNRNLSNYVKLMAAILVAVSHYSTVIVINNHWSDSAFLKLWCQGGYIGVAIFFFFSGFGLMESEKKQHLCLANFVKKRFMNVYLPVLFVSALWIPLYYLFVSTQMDDLSFGDVAYNLVWGFLDPVLWFVKILFFLYVCFYIFSMLRSKGKVIISQLFMALSTGTATWVAYYYDYPFISVPLFGIGVFASIYSRKTFAKIPIAIWLIATMALVCAALFVVTKGADPAHGVINCAILIGAIVFILTLDKITPPHIAKHLYFSNLHHIHCAFQSS